MYWNQTERHMAYQRGGLSHWLLIKLFSKQDLFFKKVKRTNCITIKYVVKSEGNSLWLHMFTVFLHRLPCVRTRHSSTHSNTHNVLFSCSAASLILWNRQLLWCWWGECSSRSAGTLNCLMSIEVAALTDAELLWLIKVSMSPHGKALCIS